MSEPTFAGCSHLECTRTGERYDSERLQTLSAAGAPLYPRYDLASLRTRWRRDDLVGRAADLWRYAGICRVQNLMRPYLEALS